MNKFLITIVKTLILYYHFPTLKVGSYKDSIPEFLQFYIVYQFTCAGCNACYTGEAKLSVNSRIEQRLQKHENFHILKPLQENSQCRQVSNFHYFNVINPDNSCFRLQLKEVMHVTWKNPISNKQIKYVTITLSI